jgi:hypothetical protein
MMKIMEYFSHGRQKFVGTVLSVGLANFYGLLLFACGILVIFSKTSGDLSKLSVGTNAFQVA